MVQSGGRAVGEHGNSVNQRWQPNEFLSLVGQKLGSAVADEISPPVASIGWKLMMAEYHAEQATRLLDSLPPADTDARVWAAKQLIIEASPGRRDRPLRVGQFEAEAHAIACAQALHSAVDLFGPVVYAGLALGAHGSIGIHENQRYPRNVLERLKKLSVAPGVVSALRSVLDSSAYRYIQGYTNVTKHRSLVPAFYSVSFEAEPSGTTHGMRISEFEYKGKKFASIWANELVNDYRLSIRISVVALGSALNRAL